HIITTGAADQLFQFSHYLGSLAACSTLRFQYHVQLAAHLIKQDTACVLGKFLEFAGIHQFPTQPFNRTALELASHLTGQLYFFCVRSALGCRPGFPSARLHVASAGIRLTRLHWSTKAWRSRL